MCGREALRDELLDGFENGDERPLVVDRAAGVDRRVSALADDLGGERRVIPLLVDDRHDVEVRHEHERVGCLCPGPPVEQRMPVDDLALERFVGVRVEPDERGEEVVERLPVDLGLVGAGDGRNLQQFAKAGDRGVVGRSHPTSLAPRAIRPRRPRRCGG